MNYRIKLVPKPNSPRNYPIQGRAVPENLRLEFSEKQRRNLKDREREREEEEEELNKAKMENEREELSVRQGNELRMPKLLHSLSSLNCRCHIQTQYKYFNV